MRKHAVNGPAKQQLKDCSVNLAHVQATFAQVFGVRCHMPSSEPYFYDPAYQHVKRDYAIPIDENGICMVARGMYGSKFRQTRKLTRQMNPRNECSSECKRINCTVIFSSL